VTNRAILPAPLSASISAGGLQVLNGRNEVACRAPHAQAIFDGVLFNRGELQSCYAPENREASDPELVLSAYLRLGTKFIHAIKGIFMVAIWDEEQRLGFCARDPLGVYPFFYTDTGESLLISTSIRALLGEENVRRDLNRVALACRLLHLGLEREETFYEHILRLPAGHCMRVGSGGIEVSRYWDPCPPGAEFCWAKPDEIERFDSLFDQAVERCLRMGPAGVFLSGGLDSITVAAASVQTLKNQGLSAPWALSMIFPHEECREDGIQKGVAGTLDMPQLLTPLEEASGPHGLMLSGLELGRTWPTPLNDLWLAAYRYLAGRAHDRGCRIILTGAGGDEWLTVSPLWAADLIRTGDFAGFYSFWNNQRRGYQAPALHILKELLWTYGMRPLLGDFCRNTLMQRHVPLLTHTAKMVFETRSRNRLQAAIPEWALPDSTLRRQVLDRLQAPKASHANGGFYVRQSRGALDHPLAASQSEDLFENGCQLGMRFMRPFFDSEIVDLLYRVPPHLLNQGGRTKGLVRHSMARRFPQLGLHTLKKATARNFSASIMLKEGPSAWTALGGVQLLGDSGIVHPSLFERNYHDIISQGQANRAHLIWDAMTTEAWLQGR